MKTRILNNGDLVYNRYRIEKFIGEGGMQEVYKATDVALDRIVALKTPKSDQAAKRFQRSARVSAKVKHPSVAVTLDYFELDQRGFLIEEFIDGTDLKQVMANTYKYLDPALAAHVALHVARGIAACQRENIWHRDLKPANIMVSHDLMFTDIKITDFGISKLVEEQFKDENDGEAESSITQSQTLLGAAPYMAPEHMFTPKQADHRSDIWSFGAILFALLIGEPPYGKSFPHIAASIKSGIIPAPPTWVNTKWQFKDLFNSLWQIITACLKVDPAARPTAEQLVLNISKLCFSIHPRIFGVTGSYIIHHTSSFITVDDGPDVFYHIDSHYREGRIQIGEPVILSQHPGSPRDRAFPLLPRRTAVAITTP
jgi:serine/threonine-protein kinase